MIGARVQTLCGYASIGIATALLADGWEGVVGGFFLALAISLIVTATPRR